MSTSTERPTEHSASTGQDRKINAIRDIIFGENIKEINHEFDELKGMIQEHQRVLENQVNQVKEELEKTVRQMQQDTEEQLKNIQEDTVSRLTQLEGDVPSKTNLGRMFEEIGRRLQQSEVASVAHQNGNAE